MKNVLNYYYRLYPDNVHQNDKVFNFNYLGDKYYLVPFERPIEDAIPLFELNIEMLKRGILVHEIVPNKDKNILTSIDNIPYILVKVYINEKLPTSLIDINYLSKNTLGINHKLTLNRSGWVKLWSDKIDYIEYQINHVTKKYPLLSESLSYFIGLGENAICYVKNTYMDFKINKYNNLVVCHKRMSVNDTLFDTYNPINFVIDSKVRDLSEYIKSRIFTDEDILLGIKKYLNQNNLTLLEYRLLFGRLLFPTFYFDVYEKIISGQLDEREILKVVNKINSYEDFLRDVFKYIKMRANIPEVEWLR